MKAKLILIDAENVSGETAGKIFADLFNAMDPSPALADDLRGAPSRPHAVQSGPNPPMCCGLPMVSTSTGWTCATVQETKSGLPPANRTAS
jgi:hypothetical protein